MAVANFGLFQLEKQIVKFGFRPYGGHKVMVVDNLARERHLVHTLRLGDVEDPDIYAAAPIWDWQQSEQGKWVMSNGFDPTYIIQTDHLTFGYIVAIHAHFTPKQWTEYLFRFDFPK
jgi:hypothetical protein